MTPENESLLSETFDLLCRRYRDILRDGEDMIGADGNVVLDEDGEPRKKFPSAAMCGRIQDFLIKHDIGKSNPGAPVGMEARRLRLAQRGHLPGGGKMPPLSEEDDPATATG